MCGEIEVKTRPVLENNELGTIEISASYVSIARMMSQYTV